MSTAGCIRIRLVCRRGRLLFLDDPSDLDSFLLGAWPGYA